MVFLHIIVFNQNPIFPCELSLRATSLPAWVLGEPLFLDDLHVGQRFISAARTLGRGRDQAVRRRVRPAAVSSGRGGGTGHAVRRPGCQRAGTPRRLPCGLAGRGPADCGRNPSGPASNCCGRNESGPAILCMWRAKYSRSPVPLPIRPRERTVRCLTLTRMAETVQSFSPKFVVPRRLCDARLSSRESGNPRCRSPYRSVRR